MANKVMGWRAPGHLTSWAYSAGRPDGLGTQRIVYLTIRKKAMAKLRSITGDGLYCAYCLREMVTYSSTHPTRDHVMPRSRGGRRTVWSCIGCNHVKADMLPDEWLKFREDNPEWWKLPGHEAQARKQTAKAAAMNDPLVRAIIERFPGAKIVAVRYGR